MRESRWRKTPVRGQDGVLDTHERVLDTLVDVVHTLVGVVDTLNSGALARRFTPDPSREGALYTPERVSDTHVMDDTGVDTPSRRRECVEYTFSTTG